jgi:RNA recognition motif-containing protein
MLCVLPAAKPCYGLAAFSFRRTAGYQGESVMETRLYVGNLSYTTSEDDLRSLFTQAGPVVSAAVITDRDTGTSKGFGFVEMTSQVDAQKAISMFNAYQLGERQLKVNLAKPREERSNSGGKGYRGF